MLGAPPWNRVAPDVAGEKLPREPPLNPPRPETPAVCAAGTPDEYCPRADPARTGIISTSKRAQVDLFEAFMGSPETQGPTRIT